MKILYLLFPLLLLLVQGAAGNRAKCREKRGYCTLGRCRYPAITIGACSRFQECLSGAEPLNSMSRTSPSLLAPGTMS
uniref:Beta-defensin-like domain-containing protein n=1 Tax=Strigops habroptila TaxID=2489341 RepID=A0A672UHU8_STRHB